jgi:hypothetical protein
MLRHATIYESIPARGSALSQYPGHAGEAWLRADRPCVVSDVSLNGAKIIVQGEAAIPTHFELASMMLARGAFASWSGGMGKRPA